MTGAMSISGSPKRFIRLRLTCSASPRELLGPCLGSRGLGAGQHNVDGDTVLAPLLGGDLGQTAQSLLVGAVGKLAGDARTCRWRRRS